MQAQAGRGRRVATCFTFASTDRVDRTRLVELQQFLGASDLSPNLLAIAGQIRSMDGLEFEHWVADLFRRGGFQVEITQPSGDHGVDLWASMGTRLVAVQCKRWDGMVQGQAATFGRIRRHFGSYEIAGYFA